MNKLFMDNLFIKGFNAMHGEEPEREVMRFDMRLFFPTKLALADNGRMCQDGWFWCAVEIISSRLHSIVDKEKKNIEEKRAKIVLFKHDIYLKEKMMMWYI